jgi:hypothetical protein
MPRKITKEHAKKIVKKLKAEVLTSRKAHDLARVFYGGELVAQFGLRRGSGRDSGHDHIPEDLHLSHRQTLDLANCPLSFEEWIALLKEKGLIPKSPE